MMLLNVVYKDLIVIVEICFEIEIWVKRVI
jgi:hypothetical protein